MTRPNVSLVIPGRNVAGTLGKCLGASQQFLASGQLSEIIYVDDGSIDDSRAVAARFPARILAAGGGGPGKARNVGWLAARGGLIWFIDADCIPEDDALDLLLATMDANVAGAGGSYSNLEPESLLACLIHEEIRERHARMGREVDFLGSFNVLYRRDALDAAGGFDERDYNGPGAPGAEDADLSYRLSDQGYILRFESRSRVGHHHPVRLSSYLRSQRIHGRWAVRLYFHHRRRARRNSYSDWADHLQPVLAGASVASSPSIVLPEFWYISPLLALVAAGLHSPMALRMVRRTGEWRYALFIPLSLLRAVTRAVGLFIGTIELLWNRPKTRDDSRESATRLSR